MPGVWATPGRLSTATGSMWVMSLPSPSNYQPFAINLIGTTAAVSTTNEDKLQDNIQHLLTGIQPTHVLTVFNNPLQVFAAGLNPASSAVHGAWNFDMPPAPGATLNIVCLVQNTGTGGPDDHTIRFDWASDPWVSAGSPGTSVDITVPAPSAQWQVVSGSLATHNAAGAGDTLRMWVLNSGAGGSCRVHAVDVTLRASSLAAGKYTTGSNVYRTMDTDEADQDSPLSVALRQAQWDNLEYIRRTKVGSVLGWSDDGEKRSNEEAYGVSSAAYTRVITLPFQVPHGVTKLKWSLLGHRDGSAGKVRLTTDVDSDLGTAAKEVDVIATWTSPYTANVERYDDSGDASLGVTPGTWCELRVDLKGDGTDKAYLTGLCCWFEVP